MDQIMNEQQNERWLQVKADHESNSNPRFSSVTITSHGFS